MCQWVKRFHEKCGHQGSPFVKNRCPVAKRRHSSCLYNKVHVEEIDKDDICPDCVYKIMMKRDRRPGQAKAAGHK
jgi:DNA-directed RNA polymerase subunit RPC12/RpoP